MTEMRHIRVEREGAVGILTIARRERLNSLDVETAQDFRKAGLQLARDKEVRSVLIRGEGGVFCSGADLKYIRDGGDHADLGYLQPETRTPSEGYGEIFKQILSVSTTFVAASVPVNVFNRAEITDNVYIALFQVDEQARPYWVGNVKKLKIAGANDSSAAGTIVDALGEPAHR